MFLLAGASKKIQSMTFSTEHRADLLTQALVSLSEAFNLLLIVHFTTAGGWNPLVIFCLTFIMFSFCVAGRNQVTLLLYYYIVSSIIDTAS